MEVEFSEVTEVSSTRPPSLIDDLQGFLTKNLIACPVVDIVNSVDIVYSINSVYSFKSIFFCLLAFMFSSNGPFHR